MAKLINADKRIAEIKKLYCDGCDNRCGAKCFDCWVDDVMCLIDDAPSVDAMEVVRCRSCKDYNWIPNCDRPMCTNLRGLTIAKPNDFCPYGQRKDGYVNE